VKPPPGFYTQGRFDPIEQSRQAWAAVRVLLFRQTRSYQI
jgi:hypothetical protein